MKSYDEAVKKCKWFAIVDCKNGILKSWGAKTFIGAVFNLIRTIRIAKKWNGGVYAAAIVSKNAQNEVEQSMFGLETKEEKNND